MTATAQLPSRDPGTLPAAGRHSAWLAYVAVAALALALFALRLSAPPNLLDQDQERPASYVLDATRNGHWICQRDWLGDITSKPPLWTWLSAAGTALNGRINLFTLYLPGALAGLLTAWLMLNAGSRHFGRDAGLFAAMAVLLSPAGLKGLALARTDGVFAGAVTVAALLAWRAGTRGRGWTAFWLAGAMATLTKGPLGLVLAAGGLIACWWDARSGRPWPMRGPHWAGVGLFLLLTAGWLWLAWRAEGQDVIDKMLGKELVGHMVTDGKAPFPGALIWQPPLYFLGRAAPWSLAACIGFWRVWRHPATEETERRFERFLFCWFMTGLAIFCVSSHQRGDLLWPILPPGALLAGREIARWTARLRPVTVWRTTGAAVGVALLGFGAYYFVVTARTPVVRRTVQLRETAVTLREQVGAEFPFTHVDAPMALQFYLNTARPHITMERAAALLRGPEPAFVTVRDPGALSAARRPGDLPLHTLLAPPAASGPGLLSIISNQPRLAVPESFALCFGALFLRVHGARLLQASDREFRLAAHDERSEVIVVNESTRPRKIRVTLVYGGRHQARERVLQGQETWRVGLGG